ncbi:MAG: RHS repeat-associated core domain-containing protein, partial [Clostridia bacterium]|nr:RHS repeat-associated core domain-containing protein [Clostridia bacterium]
EIYDTNGVRKVKYNYDAWGNCTVSSQTTDAVLARVNPIRYRGYYYDVGTGLYYLNARYYNPQWRRFISPDSTEYIDPEAVNGLNRYVYCGNNPVIHKQGSIKPDKSIAISPIPRVSATSRAQIGEYQIANPLAAPKLSNMNIFGYEWRTSRGWNDCTISNPFIRIGISSYKTYTQGSSGILYAFAGSTSEIMNLFGATYYAGIGINLFDIVGVEIQLEMLGIGAQVSIGNFIIGANINVLGATSITIGRDVDLGNGWTRTDAVTIGINTGLLATAILWLYKLSMTGDPSPIPIS